MKLILINEKKTAQIQGKFKTLLNFINKLTIEIFNNLHKKFKLYREIKDLNANKNKFIKIRRISKILK